MGKSNKIPAPVVCLVILAVVVLIPTCIGMYFGFDPGASPGSNPIARGQSRAPSRAPKQADPVEAHVVCKDFVKDKLKSPSSADFPWVAASNVVTSLGNNRFRARSYVDAQNSFGAMLRSQYDCTVEYVPATKSWRLQNLEIE